MAAQVLTTQLLQEERLHLCQILALRVLIARDGAVQSKGQGLGRGVRGMGLVIAG